MPRKQKSSSGGADAVPGMSAYTDPWVVWNGMRVFKTTGSAMDAFWTSVLGRHRGADRK